MKIENNQSVSLVQKELLARLKQERINQQITQQELASKTGLSRLAISKMERGEGLRLASFLLYLKGLNALGLLENLFPGPGSKPSDLFQLHHPRKRVSHPKKKTNSATWKWGDES
jgi:transcriptional regulator with XRE-family HTH domain